MWLLLFICCLSFNLGFSFESQSHRAAHNLQSPQQIPKASERFISTNEFLISKQPECATDVHRICDDNILNDNFAVLECIQNDRKKEGGDLTKECNNLIWNYKLNLTADGRFETIAKRVCSSLIKQYPECKPHELERGQLLSCLLDNVENVTTPPSDSTVLPPKCHSFLQKMAIMVFSDYRLIYRFTDACRADIDKLHCGHPGEVNSNAPHSQGETIECLSKNPDNLGADCRREILRIAELQGEDFHLDRPLFFACRDDREHFCPQVVSGDSRVYHCLLRHRSHRDMSQECREKLYRRERLAVHDYKVNRRLARACRETIRSHHCREDTSDHREIRLAQILLCLENALHKGFEIPGECQAEMLEHRRALMENYQLTPELASACANDVSTLCQGTKMDGTLHCLMDHARRGSPHPITTACRRQLEAVLRVSDAGEDWRVDPVLQEACQSMVSARCSQVTPGEGRVLACLFDHLGSPSMNPECHDALLQIQYFMARDFKLDPQLYKRCHTEAVRHCHAKKEWWDKQSNMDPERGPIVLPCLYRYAYHPDENAKLSRECLYEVRRVMRQRAVSVDLHPEIEEPCLIDLSRFCSANIGPGQELLCLQKNLEHLKPECAEAIANYTEEEAEHLELNYPLYHACSDLLPKFCPEVAQDVDQGDLLQCLILHKNEPEMKINQRCRLAVEHFQLLSLKDFRFSPKFKQACKDDVLKHCKNIKTKWEMVACLSGIVTSDALQPKPHHPKPRISKACRAQLRVELLQRDENIRMNVMVDKACTDDQAKFCSNVSPGEGQVLECLKQHRADLQPNCHRAIFQVEKEEMMDNSVDYTLISACKAAIRKFCDGEDSNQVLECLKAHRREHGMDDRCHRVVLARMVEQNSDFRLNIRLQQACLHDIPKFCRNTLDRYQSHPDLEGRVISCLRKYNRQDLLSEGCREEVLLVIREAGEDVSLDPVLARACATDLANCSGSSECLRSRFRARQIMDTACTTALANWIVDARADIHADPVLYRACALDLRRHCRDLPAGHGRLLSCLLSAMEHNAGTASELSPDCQDTLSTRVQMFEFAVQFAPIDSPRELIYQIANSHSRSYLLITLLAVLGLIFFGGLFCGRATKRLPASLKNK